MTQTILVVGATGQQGGATVDALLSGEFGDFDVRGLTRDAGSGAAQALSERGVEVIEGDMLDPDSLRRAMEGVDAAFAVTTFFEVGAEKERVQGENVVAAAEAVDLPYLVFSSVGSADADTGLPHFDSKGDIERRLAESSVPSTVLRPVFFTQNLAGSVEEIRQGRLPMALEEGVELAMVDAADIGRAAAVAFADPEAYVGETITLAGEELTLDETAAVLSEYLDREVTPVHIGVEDLRAAMGDEFADMFAWFNAEGYDVDVAATEDRLGIDLHSLSESLERGEFLPREPVAQA